jgi:hypothetical protein
VHAQPILHIFVTKKDWLQVSLALLLTECTLWLKRLWQKCCCLEVLSSASFNELRCLQLWLLQSIINRRLDEVSRREPSPFYRAVFATDSLTRECEAHVLDISTFQGRICEGIEAVLLEIARLRVHGISDVCPVTLALPCMVLLCLLRVFAE